ncbi:hypothetical protein KI809_00200 [Geobacter pelophilus]|uniref:CARDB domain-containing protein n=1 Tax=Geoanaerobacter pelophilus TaxID=60036 RepID=A0AAW4L249_9BACT|nr:CARDB domain-containing protein [Geoanaerobacter pelophilus]MBT0662710.1 hypothetical protein [Geoanaerobacter pelophilus]
MRILFFRLLTFFCILVPSLNSYGWIGDQWSSISRQTIVQNASKMIDSTWTPTNIINNYVSGTWKEFLPGTMYVGEPYSTNIPQESWEEFNNAIDKAEGNTYLGNHCSGFVSMSWQLPYVYTTTNFEQNLGLSYLYALGNVGASANVNLMPGDALNYSGSHILMFDKYNPDGTIQSLEQAPWHARRRTWTWSNLNYYRPIRRDLLQGGHAVNDRILTTIEVEARSCPSLSCGQSIWVIPQDSTGIIVDGPQYGDKFKWWKIQYDNGMSGWSIEGYLEKIVDNSVQCENVIDNNSPNGTILINNNAQYSNSRSLLLALTCTDIESACSWMQFSADNLNWSPWEAYLPIKKWTMPEGNGPMTVYARFKDSCGNVSDVYRDEIVLQSVNPDLQISLLSVPAYGGAGAAINLTDTTVNNGLGGANQSITTFNLLIRTSAISEDRLLGSRWVSALEPGGSSAGTISANLPADIPPGKYTITAKADGEVKDSIYMFGTSSIVESSENNNTKSATIRIGPDLVVTSLSLPVTAGAGSTVNLTDITRNIGSSSSGSFTTDFFLSTNTALDSSDIFLGRRVVHALAANESNTGTTSLFIPNNLPVAKYYVIAKADASNTVAEADKTNNSRYASVSIGPDLVISALSVPPTTASGATINITDTTRNIGGGSASATITSFYLSANTLLDTSDIFLGSRAVPSLASGVLNTTTTEASIPLSTPAGKFYILAKADDPMVVTEINETNNTKYATVSIGPDLIISSLTVPAAVVAGSVLMVSDITRNSGSASANASTTSFYLSTNTTHEVSDIFLGSRAVSALVAGASNKAASALAIPSSTSPGLYYVLSQADALNETVESNEKNNTSYKQVMVQIE